MSGKALVSLTQSDEITDITLFETDVAEFIDLHCYRPLKQLNLGKLLHQLLHLATKNHLSISPDLFLMIKSLSTAEGLGRLLDPDLDVIAEATPSIKRIHLERMSPRRLSKEFSRSGRDLFHLMKEIPGEVRTILKLTRQGKIKMEFEHRGLETMLATHDRISNRLSFAVVLASLVIGSGLIVLSGIPPKWQEIPIIGMAGFLLAGCMGFWLLISIIRNGKM